MTTLLVHAQVSDFAKWKAVFDSGINIRNSKGELSEDIYRDVDSPNNITIVFNWDTLEKAKKYIQSPELKEAMQRAGVTEPPKGFFLNKA